MVLSRMWSQGELTEYPTFRSEVEDSLKFSSSLCKLEGEITWRHDVILFAKFYPMAETMTIPEFQDYAKKRE